MLAFDRPILGAPDSDTLQPAIQPPRDFGSNQDRLAALSLPAANGPTTGAPSADPFGDRLKKEYQPLLTSLEGSKNDAGRQKAALDAVDWSRKNMVDQAEVQAYLGRADISMEEKTATMGKLAVEIARGELLSGWSYEGGVDKGGANGWENDGKNSGAFPTYYQDQVKTAGTGDGNAWCTSFVGSAYKQAGFQFNKDNNATTAKSPFWSGLRLNTWATTGQSIDGKTLAPNGSRVVDPATGGKYIGAGTDKKGNPVGWSKLDADLRADKTGKKRGDIAAQFAAANGSLQPGDILVLGNDHDYRSGGASHTVMVESYDPKTQTITTIEGNKGDKVTSTKIDLRDPAAVSKIISSTRLGADMFMTPETRKKAGEKPSDTPDPNALGADTLLDRARRVNDLTGGVAGRKGWINDKDTTASAYRWMNGAGNGKDDAASDR